MAAATNEVAVNNVANEGKNKKQQHFSIQLIVLVYQNALLLDNYRYYEAYAVPEKD